MGGYTRNHELPDGDVLHQLLSALAAEVVKLAYALAEERGATTPTEADILRAWRLVLRSER